jgi:beta-fructofuranosidase
MLYCLLSGILCLFCGSAFTEEQPDYTSRIPQYAFANTLEEQERQLEDNPMLQEFAESRKALAADPYRPLYHYVNPQGNLNDPNGLCFWQGRWHLFYQAYPPEDPRQHWGHAVSDDLIHWRDLPLAIYPNPEGRCHSGATFVEEERVIAAYSGWTHGLMIAVSSDPLLLNWEKLKLSPVDATTGEPTRRPGGDACIWKEGDYYYALSGGKKGKGKNRIRVQLLHRSRNLVDWEVNRHMFLENDIDLRIGDDGACPNFWPIGNKHILLAFSHVSGSNYSIGFYDRQREKFVIERYGEFNHGAIEQGGLLAPSATPDDQGGVIAIFNMSPARPTDGWNQIMSLPRRLTLHDNDELRMEPVEGVKSLRTHNTKVEPMQLPANKEIVLEEVTGNVLEIHAVIKVTDGSVIELNVLRSPEKEEYTRIVFLNNRGYRDLDRWDGWGVEEIKKTTDGVLVLDSTNASVLPDVFARPPEGASLFLEPGELLELRIFIDKSVVEVFANEKQAISQRVYPGLRDSTGVSIKSIGRNSGLVSLDAWKMKSIYEDD